MISLGIPLETTLLLLNSAEVRDLYDLSQNKVDNTSPNLKMLLDSRIASLKAKVTEEKNKNGKVKFAQVNKDLLVKAVDSTKDLSDNERLQILYAFSRLNKIKNWTAKMRPAVVLSQGLPQNVPTTKKNIKDLQELFGKDAQADVTSIFKSKTWQSTNLKVFSQIYQDLLPNVLLTMSPEFAEILSPVNDNLDIDNNKFGFDTAAKVEQDLLSYLTIKSYKHLLNNSSSNAAPVTNNLIYPGPINEADLSIVKMIRDEKTRRSENNEESNFFLDSFVGTEYATDNGNTTGLNIATSNTWRRLNAANLIDLQTSFAKLYGGLETRDLAISILHYMMVKDGLQLKYGSLLKAMSPFVMEKYLNNVNTVELALKGIIPYEKAFGITKEELIKEFKEGYLESNPTGPILRNYKTSDVEYLPVEEVVYIKDEMEDNGKMIDYFRLDLSDAMSKTYKLFKRDEEADVVDGKVVYRLVPSMGSNQQFAAGFVGGPRLTYIQTRNINSNTPVNDVIRSEQPIQQTDEAGASVGVSAVETQQKQDILRTPGAIIEVTNNSVEVKENDEQANTNIADTAKALEALSDLTASGTFDEVANAEMENNSQTLDTRTEEQQSQENQLKLDLAESEEMSEVVSLEKWWSDNVAGNTEAEKKMSEQGINSLQDAMFAYGDLFSQTELGEQELIDRLKCLL